MSVTAPGRFAATVPRLDFDRLWMQRGSESLPRIWHVGPSRERSIIGFLTGREAGAIRNGVAFRLGDMALLGRHHDYNYLTLGPVEWGAMSLPFADMAEIEEGYAGRDLSPRQDEQIVTPPPTALAKLLILHAAAGHLAKHAPEIIANPEAARGLEHALVEAMVDCLVMPDRHEDTAARRRHTLIMQRFHAALEASDDTAVYLPELCKRIGALSDSAVVLPAAYRYEPEAIPVAAAHALGAPGTPPGGPDDDGNRHRDALRVLGTRPLFRPLQGAVRRVAVGDAAAMCFSSLSVRRPAHREPDRNSCQFCIDGR
jgi:hypothetical protein